MTNWHKSRTSAGHGVHSPPEPYMAYKFIDTSAKCSNQGEKKKVLYVTGLIMISNGLHGSENLGCGLKTLNIGIIYDHPWA